MLRFVKFLKLKVPNYFWMIAGPHISEGVQILQYLLRSVWAGGPNTSKYLDPLGVHLFQRGSKYFSTIPKYTDWGVPILRSIWTGGNHLGGSIFFVTGQHAYCSWIYRPLCKETWLSNTVSAEQLWTSIQVSTHSSHCRYGGKVRGTSVPGQSECIEPSTDTPHQATCHGGELLVHAA